MRLDRRNYPVFIPTKGGIYELMDGCLIDFLRADIVTCDVICELLTEEEINFIVEDRKDFASRRKLALLLEEKYRMAEKKKWAASLN
jgi:hypothetical protein